MTNVVEVKEVKKIYGKARGEQTTALKDVSFQVEKGEFIGIMGASGSGKSTLLNILSTLDKPTSGNVQINGHDITGLKGNALADFRAHQIGFIFQDFNLLENLTSEENIALPLSLQGVSPRQIKAMVKMIAQKLSIEEILPKYPTEISGGQKQRVAAARALVTKPAILFGDEPTGALDSNSARELLTTMSSLNFKDQISILLVTHDPFSASFCQRILFIKDGVIFRELKRNQQDRESFYHQILDELGTFND
ncbi:ABC transporter ATP-binding protein [Xylocopilactobacillus apicola]|uniref:Bacitracin ABC transporter ATP-binding protein n=1 Tax=Xylocopilactobacillus apicola TaxID=2932184 RepID=A0AAU9DE72_9LACO|nr:ABC transporter ATP-binding protein [Xylocopilactobacillus apicola]BDR59162.1 bacitracin ABC transporter ATP-binding protein [Xylocopilactobacillus apicola]